jgi:hypothetical protein
MSYTLLAVVFIVGGVALSSGAILGGRRLLRPHVAEGHNDVLVPMFLTAGVIYAVLLGFLIVGMLDTYEAARNNTSHEASLLVPLYRQSEVMAPEKGAEMRELIRSYAEGVVSGWARFQQTGLGSVSARVSVDNVIKIYASLRPANKPRELIAAQFLDTLSQLIETRNTRLLQASESMSWVMWCAAIGGAAVLLVMLGTLYMDNVRPHLVMGGLLAATMGSLLYVMVLLSHPFLGPLAITPESFEADTALFNAIDTDFTTMDVTKANEK